MAPAEIRRPVAARPLSGLWRGLAIAAAYFAAGKLALLLAIPPGYAAAVWPSAGIALAGTLLYGPAVALAVWLGSFLTNIATTFDTADVTHSVTVAGMIAFGAALQAILGSSLVRRTVGAPGPLVRETDVIRFLVLSGPVASVVSAACGTATLAASGVIPPDAVPFSAFTWWIGDTIGVLIFAPLVLVAFGEPRDMWRARRIPVGVPLGITFAITVGVFLYARYWERERARAEFERQAESLSRAIERDLVSYVEGFRSIAALYAGSHRVDREEFGAFVSGLLARHPGIRGATWHPRVLDADRDRFEEQLRREGLPGFRITEYSKAMKLVPAARRAEYAPVAYIEPRAGNDAMFGYDSASRADRRVVLERTRDSGELAFTDQVRLVQANADGVLVFVPVYRNQSPHATVAERRASLAGYIGGALVLDDVLATSLAGADTDGAALWIENDRAPGGRRRVLAGNPSTGEGAVFSSAHSLQVPGLSWTVHAVRDDQFLVANQSLNAWIVLIGGLLLDSLLGTFLLILTGRTARIESLIAERTRQLSKTMDALGQELHDRELAEHALRSSENQFRSVTESANDAIIIADPDGRILRWNQAAERCFGYSEDEALGQRVAMLVPGRLRAAHEAGLASLRAGGVPRLIDRALAVRGLRKDGGEIPLEISLSTWCSDDGTFYCGIVRDVSERHLSELELQRAKEAAEAGNRAKGDFLANMSHEIRTPMNAVIGMTGLLRDTPLDSQQLEYVETIRISGDHLLALINEILDLSKIEAGHFELEISRFDVRRCVEEAIDLIAPRAADKHLALSSRIVAGVPPAISSDAGRLRQVLVNLIDNAVKFTDRGSVEVEVVEARDLAPAEGDRARCELHFSVRDTGFGIPEDQVERLFEPFTQADASVSRRFGGTGLGLTISKRLCERLGGRIWVESEVRRGSTFHFTIVAQPEAMPDAAVTAAPVAICAGAGPRPETPKLRILLAEDNAVNQKVAKLLLEQLGYRDVDAVGNGIEAIAALERQSYDVVLMDVQMPEMDGIDATRWIRGRWKNPPRIIALTAHALTGDRERFLQAGMDGYLSKPIQLAELETELARASAAALAPGAERPGAPKSGKGLASLLAQIPDVAVVSQIVDDFAAEARAAERGLRHALAQGDAKAARRISHTLASTANMVGARELAVLAREIERLAAADDAAGALARVRWLGAAVEEALGAAIVERDALIGQD